MKIETNFELTAKGERYPNEAAMVDVNQAWRPSGLGMPDNVIHISLEEVPGRQLSFAYLSRDQAISLKNELDRILSTTSL